MILMEGGEGSPKQRPLTNIENDFILSSDSTSNLLTIISGAYFTSNILTNISFSHQISDLVVVTAPIRRSKPGMEVDIY